jgi:ribose/xylose/arabinose/galactoside ABC-type transport system permease subunit
MARMSRLRTLVTAAVRGTLFWPLAALALLLIFNLIFTPGFFHIEIKDGRLFGSLIDILNRGAPVMLLAIGMSLVIATAGVDLSVGAVIAVAGAAAVLAIVSGGSVLLGVIAALAAALVAGTWNGALVAYIGIQPIVATLILMVAGRGVAQLLTNGQILTLENRRFEFIGGGYLGGLPFSVIIVAVIFLVVALLTRRTALGLFIESIGDNEIAARYAGINDRLVKTMVYAVCGLCAGVAGLIIASDIKAADANNAGLWLELDAILAVVIGGTSLTGGRFYLFGSLVGALIIQTLTTTILSRGVAVEFTLVVKAIVVLAVCLLQSEAFRDSVVRRLRWKRA